MPQLHIVNIAIPLYVDKPEEAIQNAWMLLQTHQTHPLQVSTTVQRVYALEDANRPDPTPQASDGGI